jgi:hypothetical protein
MRRRLRASTGWDQGVVPVETGSPDAVTAKRLLDHAKLRGFEFRRIAPGEDGPLMETESAATG